MPNKCYCGNQNLEEYSEHYWKCTECETLVSKYDFTTDISQVKNESESLYGENYWKQQMQKRSGAHSLEEQIDMYLKDRCLYWLKYLLQYPLTSGKIAEVGCGLGQLSYLLKFCGFEQVAFELSPEICRYVKEKLNINIMCGELVGSKEEFSAVLGFDLFEHIVYPNKFLSTISEVLKPVGFLCLQLPCYNPDLSYEQMLEKAPRFAELLVAEEHVYLYSKKSIKRLLANHGFSYVNFEPAYFGDDYDMFLFASKIPLNLKSLSDARKELNMNSNGKIINALVSLFDEKNEYLTKSQRVEQESNDRLRNNEILEKMLLESEEESRKRLRNNETLEKMLAESEQESTARLKNNETLEKMLAESEQDRANRLNSIESLQSSVDRLQQELLNVSTKYEAYKESVENHDKICNK